MAKNNQRDPNLRAKTVARVNQLLKGGLSKAAAFEKISAETGRAKDAVQMLYYRAVRATKASKAPAGQAAPKANPTPTAKPVSKARRARRSAPKVAAPSRGSEFPALLSGVATSINNLLMHFERTVEENKTLKEHAKRLQAITSLIRGK